jgi:hypothetical protein
VAKRHSEDLSGDPENPLGKIGYMTRKYSTQPALMIMQMRPGASKTLKIN